MLKGIKNFLYKCDFFYSTELLRYKTEPEYRTLFGGILSLLIIIGLIVTFYSKLIDTVNKVVISSVSSNLNAADPPAFQISTFPEDNFMFGVEIWHHDLNTGPRYFDVILTNVELDTGERRDSSPIYPLEACTLDHWEGFPEVQKDFERLKMNYWLCLPRNMKYNIQGKYASVFSTTLQVAVKKCTNESDPLRPCANQSEIDAYFDQQGSFFFTIYFINPLINPTSEEYLTHYLQDNNYIIFTDTFGSEGVLFMEEYKITTDESILPFAITHQNNGGIVTEFALKNPYEVTGDVYCSFAFFKSGISRSYERNFQKLDQILSYIGGLFGTIAIVLFVVNAYNGHSFEITLGAYLFQSKDEKQGNNLKKYNFLNFLLQGIYSFLSIFGCSPKWKKIKEYHICREEMTKQLDVLYLLKRVFFLERIMSILFEEHQLKGLHLQQKMTLQEAKRLRKNFQIKKNILKKRHSSKPLKESQIEVNLTEQQFKLQKAHNIENFKHSQQKMERNRQEVRDFNDKTQINTDNFKQKQKIENLLSEDSDSSQSENDGDIGYEVNKLKREADQGNHLSKKIWKRIDKKIMGQLRYIIKSERSLEMADSEVLEESISDKTNSQTLKINGYVEENNKEGSNSSKNIETQQYSTMINIRNVNSQKIKVKHSRAGHLQTRKSFENHENVLLEDELSSQNNEFK